MLVTVSRLALEKNIAFLLHVAQDLVRTFPELLFVIAGEGPDAPRLATLVRKLGLGRNVRFFGNFERAELPDCYCAADVFVFASPTETQGLVLIEAMASGVAIVSTAVMGTAMVLRGVNSALVSPEEVAEFSKCVARVLREPVLRESLAAAGWEDAKAWSSEALTRQATALYTELAASRSISVPRHA